MQKTGLQEAFFIKVLLGALCAVLLWAGDALATQQHADPEGLYSHQIAHVFFMLAMVVLAVQIHKNRPAQQGWKSIGIAAVLFLLWNIDTFTVHIITEQLPEEVFYVDNGIWSTRADLSMARAKLFYLGKILDHVFLVGSIGVFLRGILEFRAGIEHSCEQQ